MKGIVFTEFIEMVEQKFSTRVANRLLDESSLPSGGAYTAVGTYDHQELVSMVAKLSEITGLPIPVLIKTFGIHLFGRFHALFPAFFEGVTSAPDFLARIEDIVHVEVLKLYPDAQLPHFEIARPDSHSLIMTYHSERHFGDLAQGLIEACIEHFGEPLNLTRENLTEPGQPIRFILSKTT
jgi:hypothetical protein